MTHIAFDDVADVVAIQAGAVVSKVIHRDDALDVTVFGFDAGEGISEHAASRTAIVQVLRGRLRSRSTATTSTPAREAGSTWPRERRTRWSPRSRR